MSRFFMGGSSSQPAKPSFFKVLIGQDFSRQLRLPVVFVRDHGETLAENVLLRASSEKSWVVKLEHIDDEKYFTRGWSKFSEDLGLKMGEFLVFWLAGESLFDVSVYGISGCRRVVSNCKSDSGKEVEVMSLEKDAISPPYFEIVLKKQHFSMVSVSINFIKMCGLIDQNSVLLEYVPKQHFAYAAVRLRPKSRVELVWPGFIKQNQMVFGRTYSFQFDPNKNVIRVDQINK